MLGNLDMTLTSSKNTFGTQKYRSDRTSDVFKGLVARRIVHHTLSQGLANLFSTPDPCPIKWWFIVLCILVGSLLPPQFFSFRRCSVFLRSLSYLWLKVRFFNFKIFLYSNL